jgi:arabinose-5-phosphate isomerase
MSKVIEEISEKGLGMTCVIDKEKNLVGIITDGDLRRLLQKHKKNSLVKTAKDCMSSNPLTIDKDDLATTALQIMEEKKITSLIITNKNNKIEGLIHLHDLWRTEMF